MEDDFTFVVSKEEFEEQLTFFFNEQIDYDVFMISYNLMKHTTTDYEHMFKILNVQFASGYIVNQLYYDKLIELYEYAMPLLESTREHWNYANDAVWNRFVPDDKWFCFDKHIGKQRPSSSDTSDNGNRFVDFRA